MQEDVFISSETENRQQIDEHKDTNFFVQPQQIVIHSPNNEMLRHLNGYDNKILEDEAYQEVNDEVFKIEYKISKLEDELRSIDSRIVAAKEIGDVYALTNLGNKKEQLGADIKDLYKIYNDISLSAKISGGVTNSLKSNISSYKFKLLNLLSRLFSKFSCKVSSLIMLKQSLQKLESISKNVDELVSMQIPYGEASEKYLQLSKYILKANNIQSQISKHIK